MLSILLWPLVVYHELIQRMYTRLEPLLMQLDYSMKAEADALHHKHDKKSKGLPYPTGVLQRGHWFMTHDVPWNLLSTSLALFVPHNCLCLVTDVLFLFL